MNKRLAWLVLVVYLLLISLAAAQPLIPPAPTHSIYVQDHAGVLNSDTKNKINTLGGQLADRTKAQIVVLTVKSLEGAAVEEYALEVLRRWGIGDKQLNNGVLVLVAVDDRQARIEVGYGLEGVLNDAKTGAVQDDYMLPYFAANDYNQGIWNGYQALVSIAAQEYQLDINTDAEAAKVRSAAANPSWWDTLPWWGQLAVGAGVMALFVFDWLFLGGSITYLILSLLRFRGGGGGGGYGGGSGGGGGSSRKW